MTASDIALPALAAVLLVLILLVRRYVFGSTTLGGAFGVLYTGLRRDGWPVGVQEEDRDRPWGKPPPPVLGALHEGKPELRQVKASVRIR